MGKVVEIDCEKSMKLETSPKVTKSKRSLHWCRSISKKISVQVLLQYQSKSYYIIGQEVYYSIGRLLHYRAVITLSGIFYYIIGQLLQYRAFITLSVGTSAKPDFVKYMFKYELHRAEPQLYSGHKITKLLQQLQLNNIIIEVCCYVKKSENYYLQDI